MSSSLAWLHPRAALLSSLTHAPRRSAVRTRLLATIRATTSSRFSSSAHPRTNDSAITPQSTRLSGRRCLITGGTSGIGLAIAERFLQEGASSVVLVGRSKQRLEAAAESLRSSTSNSSSNDATITSNGGDSEGNTPSDEVRLLVGDVGDAGSWMRELEKEMVSLNFLCQNEPSFLTTL